MDSEAVYIPLRAQWPVILYWNYNFVAQSYNFNKSLSHIPPDTNYCFLFRFFSSKLHLCLEVFMFPVSCFMFLSFYSEIDEGLSCDVWAWCKWCDEYWLDDQLYLTTATILCSVRPVGMPMQWIAEERFRLLRTCCHNHSLASTWPSYLLLKVYSSESFWYNPSTSLNI